MLRSILLFLIFSLFIFYNGHPQNKQQEFGLAAYNIGFGALTSGIGAVINKPKGEDFKKTFIRGFWQGSIGGLLNYGGKKTVYLMNKKNEKLYAWPANMLHYAGMSIMENASLNEPFLQNWHYDYAFVRFDFSVNGEKKFRARLLPMGIYSMIDASRFGKFDVKKTLQTGHLIYINRDRYSIIVDGRQALGCSFGRSIAIGSQSPQTNMVIAHELVHEFQYSDYQIFNTWLNPLTKKIKSPVINKIFTKYVYFDMPYFWLPYEIQGRFDYPHYFRNFYEFEAHHFATNSYVPR